MEVDQTLEVIALESFEESAPESEACVTTALLVFDVYVEVDSSEHGPVVEARFEVATGELVRVFLRD